MGQQIQARDCAAARSEDRRRTGTQLLDERREIFGEEPRIGNRVRLSGAESDAAWIVPNDREMFTKSNRKRLEASYADLVWLPRATIGIVRGISKENRKIFFRN
jgi:fructosamine-3-kinase